MKDEKTLFLQLDGKFKYDKNLKTYKFKLIGETNKNLLSEIINYIADPSYDSIFKILFGGENGKARLIDFINSIMFPNEEDDIEKLTYINNEFPILDSKKGKSFILADIVCEIKTKNNKKPFLLCIEMEIGNNGNFSNRLIKYSTSLRNANKFKDCYAIGLYLRNKDEYRGTNCINLIKNKKINLKNINIIDIDINDKICNIDKDEPVIINGKEIGNNGKEYIKLLGIRNWGITDVFKYVLPKISILSENQIFIECLEILGSFSQNALSLLRVDEQSILDDTKIIQDKENIFGAFIAFIQKSDPLKFLNKYNVDLEDYTDDYIKSVLKRQDIKLVNEFVQILKDNNLLSEEVPLSDNSD